MALDPRLSLMVQHADIDDPQQLQARKLTLGNLALNMQQTGLENARLQRQAANEPAIAEAARQKAIRDQKKADLDAEEQELKTAAVRAARLGSVTGSIKDLPTKDWAVGQLVREGLIPKEHEAGLIAAPWDDAFKTQLQQFRDQALTAGQQLDQALKDRQEKRAAGAATATADYRKTTQANTAEYRRDTAANTKAERDEAARRHKATEARLAGKTPGGGGGGATNTQLNAVEGRKQAALHAAEAAFKTATTGAAGQVRMNEHLGELRKAKQGAQARYEQELRQHGLPVRGFQYSDEAQPDTEGARPPAGPASAALAAKTATMDQVRAFAQAHSMTEAAALEAVKRQGFTVK